MKRLAMKALSAMCLVLALAPVAVLAALGAPWRGIAWTAGAALLALLVALLPGRVRLVAGGLLSVAGIAAVFVLAAGMWPALIPCLIAFWAMLWQAARPPFEEWSISALLCGLCAYPACMIGARLMGDLTKGPLFRWLFLAYIVVFLLVSNHTALAAGASARDGRRPPRRIRTGNLRLAAGVAALVVILANLRAIRDAFAAAFTWIGRQVGRFIQWLLSLLKREEALETALPQEEAGIMEMAAEGETALIWVILDQIIRVVAIILAIIIAIWLLRRLYKLLVRASRWLAARLRLMARHLGEGVQEQAESIFDWDEMRGAARKRLQSVRGRMARPPRWQSFADDRARVRWVYGKWRGEQPGIRDSATARESLRAKEDGERMAAIYERARYSDMAVTEEEALFMRDAARREG